MKKPLISIIVPVYNTEKYLEECISSILLQSYTNIEVICVNDASPDNSNKILKRIALQDSRVRVIEHEQNGGLGAARNTGIQNSNGEFIASVDSDDIILPEMIDEMQKCQLESDADIVVCGINTLNDDLSTSQRYLPDFSYVEVSNKFTNLFRLTNPSFCNKLWRKSLFDKSDIQFPSKIYFEDLATTPKLLSYSNIVAGCQTCFYNYRSRDGSITASVSPVHIHDYIAVFSDLQAFLIKNNLWIYQNGFYHDEITYAFEYFSRCIEASNLAPSEQKSLLSLSYLVRSAYLQQGSAILDLEFDELKELMKK